MVNVNKKRILLYATAIVVSIKKKNKHKKRLRRWYARPINENKAKECYHQHYFKKMMVMDAEQFFKHTRMTTALFNTLLVFVEPHLTKPRQRIHADERLAITLLFLAHGVGIQAIAWMYHIGKATVREIVLETCDVLWTVLSPLYLAEPTQSQYADIAQEFNAKWNFPNCVGALDGKHIAVKCPSKSGSMYFNYKKFFSIVLMALCDADYTFTAISIGSSGSESDSGVFKSSKFGLALQEDKLPLPPDAALTSSGAKLPHVIVADAAFPLGMRIMRPYAANRSSVPFDTKQRVFNYRLSRARRTIENAFGVLTSIWRTLRTTLEFMPENAERIVLACVALHNFVMLHNRARYCPEAYVDSETSDASIVPGQWRSEVDGNLFSITATHSRRSGGQCLELRDKFADYFVNEDYPDTRDQGQ